MHCHCGTNNRAPRWTFMDPCKPVKSKVSNVLFYDFEDLKFEK